MEEQVTPSTEHLEERLLDLYVLRAPEVNERRGEIAAHLEQCAGCTKRHQEISEYYAEVEELQKTEAESIFPALQASSRLVRFPFVDERGPLSPVRRRAVQIFVTSFKAYPIRWSAAFAVILTIAILLVPKLITTDRNAAYVRAWNGYLIVQDKNGEELWRKYIGPGIDAGVLKIPLASSATSKEAIAPAKSGSAVSLAATPYELDPSTALLDHFNGTTVGMAFGSSTFESSLPAYGQAINIVRNSYVKYTLLGWGERQGTVEMWVRLRQGPPSTILALQWLDVTSSPPWGFVGNLCLTQKGKVAWGVWNDEQRDESFDGKTTIPLNEWTHIAVTWGADGTKIYVNGVVDASTSANFCPCLSSPTYAYLNNWGVWDLGYVDELRISNVTRSAEEIKAQAARTPPTSIMR
ncbi:LamG domain-containing protein [bacterium]|nr:MAG: LamG domain-containing protein [bacterium]